MSTEPEFTAGPWRVEDKRSWEVQTNARAIVDSGRFAVAWSPAWDVDDSKDGGGPASPVEGIADILKLIDDGMHGHFVSWAELSRHAEPLRSALKQARGET